MGYIGGRLHKILCELKYGKGERDDKKIELVERLHENCSLLERLEDHQLSIYNADERIVYEPALDMALADNMFNFEIANRTLTEAEYSSLLRRYGAHRKGTKPPESSVASAEKMLKAKEEELAHRLAVGRGQLNAVYRKLDVLEGSLEPTNALQAATGDSSLFYADVSKKGIEVHLGGGSSYFPKSQMSALSHNIKLTDDAEFAGFDTVELGRIIVRGNLAYEGGKPRFVPLTPKEAEEAARKHRDYLQTAREEKAKRHPEILDALNNITKTYDIEGLEDQTRYIQKLRQFHSEDGAFIIRKALSQLQDVGLHEIAYTLLYNDEAVIRFKDGDTYAIAITEKTAKPMRLHEFEYELTNGKITRQLFGVDKGGFFIVPSGFPLFYRDIPQDIFYKIETGVEILPDKSLAVLVKTPGKKGTSSMKPPPEPRHWGQAHLRDMATGDIVEGEFFATHRQYQAFPIGDKLVIESNEEGRATYIFDKDYFDKLRDTSRTKLNVEKPLGFVGKIIHGTNKKNWEQKVQEVVNPSHLL